MTHCTHRDLRPIGSQGPYIEYVCRDCGETGYGRDRLEALVEITDKYEAVERDREQIVKLGAEIPVSNEIIEEAEAVRRTMTDTASDEELIEKLTGGTGNAADTRTNQGA